MSATLQFLPAWTSTPRLSEPTWLVSQHFFSTNAGLLDQKGALWALHIVRMTLMFDLRMTALSATCARKPALWRLSPALQFIVRLRDRHVGVKLRVAAGNIPAGEGKAWCGHKSS